MVKVTFGLLSKILKIFEYSGEILIYRNHAYIFKTINEDDTIEYLEDLPVDFDVGDFYVKFPGLEEMDFDKALDLIKSWESK